MSGNQAPQIKNSSTIITNSLKRTGFFIGGLAENLASSFSERQALRLDDLQLSFYFHLVRTAFKEWAIVVDALSRGEQILVLRKGGIHEDSALFEPEHSRFWLFPTLFHQQKESVLPDAQVRFEAAIEPSLNGQFVDIQYLAELHSAILVTSLHAARRLDGQHIWSGRVVEERFDWGGQKNIYALLLRVFTLPAPTQMNRLPAHGGCRSWIELDDDISEHGLKPVLSDVAFEEKIDAVLTLYFVFVRVVIDFIVPKIEGMAQIECHPIIEPLLRQPWLT